MVKKKSACSAGDFAHSLSWEDPLEEGTAPHSSILAWRTPCQGSLAGYSPWGRKESDMTKDFSLRDK